MTKVFVNGTFDIIHLGHLAMLNFAKSLGDYLIVAIDSDDRIRRLKGPSRPINNVTERKTLLENLRSVDEVQIFDTDQELIHMISNCNIMVKGGDYKYKPILGIEVCPKVVLFDRIDEYSTTQKIESIINR